MAGKPKPVLVLHNEPRARKGAGTESDAGVLSEAAAVNAALEALRVPHRVAAIRTLADLPDAILGGDERIVFNLVEGFHDRVEETDLVPAAAAAFGRSCTGNGSDALLLTLDKWRTKAVLREAGLPVPPGIVVPVGAPLPRRGLSSKPMIVKPAKADASEGIDADTSIASPGRKLEEAVRLVHERFGQPALVEELVGTRELNVSLLQRGDEIEVLPLAEIDFSRFGLGMPRIVDYAAKWVEDSFEFHHTPRLIPAPLSPALATRVRKLARAAWDVLGCRDYARVDFRLDDKGELFILEVNANPDISPDAGFAAALAAGRVEYADFVRTVVTNAESRLPAAPKRRSGPPRRKGEAVTVRRTAAADREAILELLSATRFFRDNEIDIAREVLDESIEKGASGDYQSYTAERGGRVAGWVCFGATPCTSGTYDLYWIAVSPDHQGSGAGSILMDHAEKLIAALGGRLVIVETAGREIYEPTRRFYLKLGYEESARLKDFYAPGDDKVVYTKRVGGAA